MLAVSDALLKLETKLFNNTDTKRLYHRSYSSWSLLKDIWLVTVSELTGNI